MRARVPTAGRRRSSASSVRVVSLPDRCNFSAEGLIFLNCGTFFSFMGVVLDGLDDSSVGVIHGHSVCDLERSWGISRILWAGSATLQQVRQLGGPVILPIGNAYMLFGPGPPDGRLNS